MTEHEHEHGCDHKHEHPHGPADQASCRCAGSSSELVRFSVTAPDDLLRRFDEQIAGIVCGVCHYNSYFNAASKVATKSVEAPRAVLSVEMSEAFAWIAAVFVST